MDDRRGEGAFSLIELLVVVIIIGVLASIAIPVFLNQRQRAWDSAAQSDLRNALVAMEAYATETGSWGENALDTPEWGFVSSRGVDIEDLFIADDCLAMSHEDSTVSFRVTASSGQIEEGTCS